MEIRGKIINFLGDSITEGDGVVDKANNRYDNIILREYGLKAVHNYGVCGTKIAHQSVPSEIPRHDLCFCGRAYDMNRDADIIVVFGGVNDYLHGDAPIGCKEDRRPSTFWGGVNFLMRILKYIYRDRTIVFITPARCFEHGVVSSLRRSPDPNKRDDAMPLEGYVEIIKEAGELNGIPVLDLYNTFEIDPNRPEDSARYTKDGLHFNDEGHKILARHIANYLLSL